MPGFLLVQLENLVDHLLEAREVGEKSRWREAARLPKEPRNAIAQTRERVAAGRMDSDVRADELEEAVVPEERREAGIVAGEGFAHSERVHLLVDGEPFQGLHRLRWQERAARVGDPQVPRRGTGAHGTLDTVGMHDDGLHPALEARELSHGRTGAARRRGLRARAAAGTSALSSPRGGRR